MVYFFNAHISWIYRILYRDKKFYLFLICTHLLRVNNIYERDNAAKICFFLLSKSLLNFSTPSRSSQMEIRKYASGGLTKVEYLKPLKGDVTTTSNPSPPFRVTKIYLTSIDNALKTAEIKFYTYDAEYTYTYIQNI